MNKKIIPAIIAKNQKELDERLSKVIDYVDQLFTEFGVTAEYYPKNLETVNKLVDFSRKHGINLFVRKIRHVGSDLLPKVIMNFENFLEKSGIEILTETDVKDVVVEDENGRAKVTETAVDRTIRALIEGEIDCMLANAYEMRKLIVSRDLDDTLEIANLHERRLVAVSCQT